MAREACATVGAAAEEELAGWMEEALGPAEGMMGGEEEELAEEEGNKTKEEEIAGMMAEALGPIGPLDAQALVRALHARGMFT